jgi:beta-glucosidase
MAHKFLTFPNDFIWGCATAAYQIEGAVQEDGRGPSIWDTFCRKPGAIFGGHTGDVAVDHYHRYEEDAERLSWLGLRAYRFSIAWPRVIPDGKGVVNEKGLAFYERLVDCLLRRDITPWATLYHWDLPQALEDEGGWPERCVADYFERYADVVGRRLGDRVKHWLTFNEPLSFIPFGYWVGVHAPGRREPLKIVARAAHNVMLAHGLGVQALRQACASPVEAGMAFNPTCVWPASDSVQDQDAAERAWMLTNGWWTYPMFEGKYPSEIIELLGNDMPEVRPGDMEVISTPTDFLGVNVYFRTIPKPSSSSPLGFVQAQPPDDAPRTAMGWEIWPPVIYHTLRQLEDHHPGLTYYQAENGAAFDDEIGNEGKVHDPRRVQFLRDHFAQAQRAIAEGMDLRGYFVWSLMDNFEWSYGFSKRFGVYYVDFNTLERIPKDSAHFYRDVIEKNGLMVQDDAAVGP